MANKMSAIKRKGQNPNWKNQKQDGSQPNADGNNNDGQYKPRPKSQGKRKRVGNNPNKANIAIIAKATIPQIPITTVSGSGTISQSTIPDPRIQKVVEKMQGKPLAYTGTAKTRQPSV